MRKLGLFAVILLALLASQAAAAGVQVVINSQDWHDVYSGLVYAGLEGDDAVFLVNAAHAQNLKSLLNRGAPVTVIESSSPFAVGYASTLSAAGFNASEVAGENLNFELARESGARKFIVVDSAYGYGAVSIAPYAVASKSFVLFADASNARQVADFIASQDAESVMVYGPVSPSVRDALVYFNPQTVNEGSRFANNDRAVDLFLQVKPVSQLFLSNGEFLERGLFKGDYPIFFIGADRVPDGQLDYLRAHHFEEGVVVGNELYGTGKALKDAGVLSTVLIKYAQGTAIAGGGFAQVSDLDKFPLPSLDLNVSIRLLQYNQGTGMLELVLSNDAASQLAFAKSTVTLYSPSGNKVFGDAQAITLDPSGETAVSYAADPEFFASGKVGGTVFTAYGEDSGSLDRSAQSSFDPLPVVAYADASSVQIGGVSYSPEARAFRVQLYDRGGVDAFARLSVSLAVDGVRESFSRKGSPVQLTVSDAAQYVSIPADLKAEQVDGANATVRAAYGSRERFLLKTAESSFVVSVEKGVDMQLVLVVIIVFLLLLVAYLAFSRRKYKKATMAKRKR